MRHEAPMQYPRKLVYETSELAQKIFAVIKILLRSFENIDNAIQRDLDKLVANENLMKFNKMASVQDSKYGQKDTSDQNFDYMFKLLIIGNSSVGKTSFLFRYADDSFTSAFVSTVGIDFKVKTVFKNEKRIKLQIWMLGCQGISVFCCKLSSKRNDIQNLFHKIIEYSVLEGPTRIIKPFSWPYTGEFRESHHVSEHIVQMLLELRQACCCDHFPEDPVPLFSHPLGEEPFPTIQPNPANSASGHSPGIFP
ncbi:hypothetical protein WISP_22672 [Willisornis vidua]|uniref:small monomeric GTPase n=1 Tax=Willisornis vidua TaxID=1566151 RepID=A0ABQ9DT43_9PASS|nr:hypothetical protein WISP_22672 [Willisornis vidua]